MMEAVCSFEVSMNFCRTTRCYIQENSILNNLWSLQNTKETEDRVLLVSNEASQLDVFLYSSKDKLTPESLPLELTPFFIFHETQNGIF
jgi:hypothetical protein